MAEQKITLEFNERFTGLILFAAALEGHGNARDYIEELLMDILLQKIFFASTTNTMQ